MDEGMLLSTVTVTKVMYDDDVIVSVEARDSAGEEMAIIDAVGMLEFAKDQLLHSRCCDNEANDG